jgi:hypothetical protein
VERRGVEFSATPIALQQRTVQAVADCRGHGAGRYDREVRIDFLE